MTTGWTFTYSDASGTNPKTIPLENMGLNEGGTVLGDGVKLKFTSHGASTMVLRIPNVDPDLNPQIPFKSVVSLKDGNGVTQFTGRRTDFGGQASPNQKFFDYTFEDFWWDLAHITYKQSWFAGAYTPVTLTGTSLKFTFTWGGLAGPSNLAASVRLYNSAKTFLGSASISIPATGNTATISGYTGPNSGTNAVALATIIYATTDVVLFQFYPSEVYLNSAVILDYYITTGAQIQNILLFAIAQGVNLQVGQIDPNLYVPWYPMRCPNCADAIKACLRMHPDCFTEIDYTTNPPTFNVRQRTNLTQVTLPYAFTDGANRMHISLDVKPRPDLQPSRVGIFYRYLLNGTVAEYINDIYPVNQPDGILALDYSIDLQGPKTVETIAEITSAPFDPTNSTAGQAWWLSKCKNLTAPDVTGVQMCDINGNVANPTANLTVVDDSGNPIDYVNTFTYEHIKGTVELWMSGVQIVYANVQTYFTYNQVMKNGAVRAITSAKAHTVRVKLVNTPSVVQTFTQTLATGEAIPIGFAQAIYTSLAALQYALTHKYKEQPFGGTFLKPGKHGVNLTGGNAAWLTMNATVQSSEYVLHADGNGVVWAEGTVSCGPVRHLEAGELVQLFNLFLNRDIMKIDPWERILGAANSASSIPATDDVPRENTVTGDAAPLMTNTIGITADVNGNFTVVQHDGRTSGVQLYKWNGTTLNADGTPAPVAGMSSMDLDLTQLGSDVSTAGQLQFRKFGTDTNGKPLYIVASGNGTLGGGGGTFVFWSNQAITAGTLVRVNQTGVVGNVTLAAGTYFCANSVPGGASGLTNPGDGGYNQIPQYPEPNIGVVYFYLISPGPQEFGTCSNGLQKIYVAATAPVN